MSTVMYAVRIKKDIFWEVIRKIRQLYITKHPIYNAFHENPEKYYEIFKEAMKNKTLVPKESVINESVEFQIFDDGDAFLCRALEQGYFFWNNVEQFPEAVPTFYDGRTDEGEDEFCSIEIVDRVDQLIKDEEYFICPIVSVKEVSFKAEMNRVMKAWDEDEKRKKAK